MPFEPAVEHLVDETVDDLKRLGAFVVQGRKGRTAIMNSLAKAFELGREQGFQEGVEEEANKDD